LLIFYQITTEWILTLTSHSLKARWTWLFDSVWMKLETMLDTYCKQILGKMNYPYGCCRHKYWLLFYTSQSCHRRRWDDKGGQKLIQSKAESASKLGLRRVEKYGIGTAVAKGAFTFYVDMVEWKKGFPNVYASANCLQRGRSQKLPKYCLRGMWKPLKLQRWNSRLVVNVGICPNWITWTRICQRQISLNLSSSRL